MRRPSWAGSREKRYEHWIGYNAGGGEPGHRWTTGHRLRGLAMEITYYRTTTQSNSIIRRFRSMVTGKMALNSNPRELNRVIASVKSGIPS